MPKRFDDAMRARTGLGGGGLILSRDVFSYVIGVVQRERERLAKAYADAGMPELAKAVMDDSQDEAVFKYRGPGVRLADPPPVPAVPPVVPPPAQTAPAANPRPTAGRQDMAAAPR